MDIVADEAARTVSFYIHDETLWRAWLGFARGMKDASDNGLGRLEADFFVPRGVVLTMRVQTPKEGAGPP